MDIDEVAQALKNPKLNLMEQARLLQTLEPRRRSVHGLTLREIGRRVGKSYIWVRRRLALLQLPEEVQKAAEEGLFTPTDLETMFSYGKSKWKQSSLRILADKKKGLRTEQNDLRHKTTRKSHERIRRMIRYLMGKNIGGLPIRLLAWCLGRVDDQQIYAEVKKLRGDDQNAEEDVPFTGRTGEA